VLTLDGNGEKSGVVSNRTGTTCGLFRRSDADNAVPGWAGRCATLTLRDVRLALLLHNSFVVVVGGVVVVVVVGTFHVHAASPSLCGSGRCARLPAAAAMTRAVMWECRGLGFGVWPLWVGVS
jgi:hypothetical protein